LTAQRDKIGLELATYQFSELEIEGQIERVASLLAKTQDVIEPPRNEKLITLKSKLPKDCTYGDIKFADCNYMSDHIAKLQQPWNDLLKRLRDDQAEEQSDGYDKLKQDWLAQEMKLSDRLKNVRTNIDRLRNEVQSLDGQIRELALDRGALVRISAVRSRALAESPLIGELAIIESS